MVSMSTYFLRNKCSCMCAPPETALITCLELDRSHIMFSCSHTLFLLCSAYATPGGVNLHTFFITCLLCKREQPFSWIPRARTSLYQTLLKPQNSWKREGLNLYLGFGACSNLRHNHLLLNLQTQMLLLQGVVPLPRCFHCLGIKQNQDQTHILLIELWFVPSSYKYTRWYTLGDYYVIVMSQKPKIYQIQLNSGNHNVFPQSMIPQGAYSASSSVSSFPTTACWIFWSVLTSTCLSMTLWVGYLACFKLLNYAYFDHHMVHAFQKNKKGEIDKWFIRISNFFAVFNDRY